MANLSHVRSNSLPSRSHPAAVTVQDHLCRLKSTDESSLCRNLASLGDLHESLCDLIQLPSVQQELSLGPSHKWADEILNGSVRLLDACSTTKDIILHMKESVKELKSALRRNRDGESSIARDIEAYAASEKKVNKMITKCIRNLKASKKKCSMALAKKEVNIPSTTAMLEESEVISFSFLKSALLDLSRSRDRSRQRGCSLLNKFMKSKLVHCDTEQEQEGNIYDALSALIKNNSCKESKVAAIQNVMKQLRTLEMTIQEFEELLEIIFRSLIKRRVSLLNILDH